MSWIQTYTGVAFDLLDPKAEQVNIADIAHSLAHLCRYAGHTRTFYSVAQHSIHVCHNVSPENMLVALLHDAAEAYCVDVPRPLKALLPGYSAAEQRVWCAIAERFGLPVQIPAEVKEADTRILFNERRDLMGQCEREWDLQGEPIPWLTIFPDPGPARVEAWFLDQFESLT